MNTRMQLIDILPTKLRSTYDTVLKLDSSTVNDISDTLGIRKQVIQRDLAKLRTIGLVGRLRNSDAPESKTGYLKYFVMTNDHSIRMQLHLERMQLVKTMNDACRRIQEIDLELEAEEALVDYLC